MKERLKNLRENYLNLNQDEFGKRIGLTRSAICNYENGSRKISEQTIKLICSEFNVDYLWLKEGIGDMFTNIPETIIDELVIQYDLDDLDKNIIQEYLKLDTKDRTVLKNYLKNIFNK